MSAGEWRWPSTGPTTLLSSGGLRLPIFQGQQDLMTPPFSGTEDAFIALLGSGLNSLGATYLGGTNADFATSVALDKSDNIFVAGKTQSGDFPATVDDTSYGGGVSESGHSDGFLARFNSTHSTLGTLIAATFVGGDGDCAESITGLTSGQFRCPGGGRTHLLFNFSNCPGKLRYQLQFRHRCFYQPPRGSIFRKRRRY